MKTNRLFCIFLLSLLTGGLCESSCNRKGEEGIILKDNGGKVTLQVKTTEEIQEVHWIRQQTHNVFFRMVDCCTFKNVCCRSETPKDCCRIENKTYEAKLCSCNVSSWTSSITICNITSEDEGVFLADIQHKKSNASMCQFFLSVHGNDDRDVAPEKNSKKTVHIAVIVIVVVIILLIGAVICDFMKGWIIAGWIRDRCCRGRTRRLESSAATSVLPISCRSSNSDRPNPEPDPERQPLSSGLELKPIALPTSDGSPASCRLNPEPGPGFECSSL